MEFSGIIEIVSDNSGALTTGDIASIGTSVVALLGVIISTIITVKSNKKNNIQRIDFEERQQSNNQDFEKKMQLIQIDKNIMANARIEWIQSVRQESKNFITEFYKNMEQCKLDRKIQQPSEEFRKSMYNLILYFGPDSSMNTEHDIKFDVTSKRIIFKNDKSCILMKQDRRNNDGLNNWIVGVITRLNESLASYMRYNGYLDYGIISKNLYLHSEYIEDQKSLDCGELTDRQFEAIYANKYTEEYDEYSHLPTYVSLNNMEQYLGKLQSAEKHKQFKNNAFSENTEKNIADFTKIIRIYLKVEWKNISNLDSPTKDTSN